MQNHQSAGALDITAAREYLGGVSRATVYRLIRSGDLPVVKIGGRTVFRRADLEAFLARSVGVGVQR